MNNAEIVLDGNSLTIEQVISVSNFNNNFGYIYWRGRFFNFF